MAFSVATFGGGSQQGGPFTTVSTAAQAVPNGNSLVVGMRWSAQEVHDNAGNTYKPLPFLPGNQSIAMGDGFQFFFCNNCIGNPALVITATLVSTSIALDTYTFIAGWDISGGFLTFDQQVFTTGASGTTLTTPNFYTRYPNTIACLLGNNTAALTTYGVNAPLVQDGGTSLGGQTIGGAGHAIYSALQPNTNLSMTMGSNNSWQIGGPIFGIANSTPTQKKRKSVAAAAPLFTGRMYNYYITLERMF